MLNQSIQLLNWGACYDYAHSGLVTRGSQVSPTSRVPSQEAQTIPKKNWPTKENSPNKNECEQKIWIAITLYALDWQH